MYIRINEIKIKIGNYYTVELPLQIFRDLKVNILFFLIYRCSQFVKNKKSRFHQNFCFEFNVSFFYKIDRCKLSSINYYYHYLFIFS